MRELYRKFFDYLLCDEIIYIIENIMMKKYIKTDEPLNIYGRPIGKKPRQDRLGKAKYVYGVTKVSPPPKKKNKGGDIKKLKTVAAKLSKASKAHAGQSKVLKRIVSKYV